MPALVIDVDLADPPSHLDIPSAYDHLFVLIRFRGYPVGRMLTPVTQRHWNAVELQAALADAAGWELWRRWLAHYCQRDEFAQGQALPQATVAICSRDRPDNLRRCLEGMTQLYDDGQEILVVDSCSATDDTQRVVDEFRGVRYLREDRPGLDVARNRALREARHEIVAFADDDTVPDPSWLRSLLPNFADPSVLCVTGLTVPMELQTDAQLWFERPGGFGRGFRRTVWHMHNVNPLEAWKVGVGANMALRRSVLDLVGPFDEALDAGTPTFAGGDTEMLSRILGRGHRIVYEPGAVLRHYHRRTRSELRRTLHGYGAGVYAAWTRQLWHERQLCVLRQPLAWLRYAQVPNLVRALLRRPGALPLDLVLAELRGCVAGPWAYLRSCRQQREARHG